MDHDHHTTAQAATSLPAHEPDISPDVVLPLIREELNICKEQVTKATVRLTKVVSERPELINEVLTSEHFVVERRPMDEVVVTPPTVRFEGDVIIIPVIEEVLVVKKELRLKEELRVTKKRTPHGTSPGNYTAQRRADRRTIQRTQRREIARPAYFTPRKAQQSCQKP